MLFLFLIGQPSTSAQKKKTSHTIIVHFISYYFLILIIFAWAFLSAILLLFLLPFVMSSTIIYSHSSCWFVVWPAHMKSKRLRARDRILVRLRLRFGGNCFLVANFLSHWLGKVFLNFLRLVKFPRQFS